MNSFNLLLCLFILVTCIALGSVAREAILGGVIAAQEPFRYMVSILEVNHGHICSGAMIGDQIVLTAAHCFVNSDNSFKNKRVIALLGTNDLLRFEKPAMYFEVVKVYVPKEYNATDIDTTGDIAVLRLKEPVDVSYYPNMGKLKLELNKKEFYDGKKAVIAGWGWNKIIYQYSQETGLRTDSLLRFATADVLNYRQCRQELPTLTIYQEQLCAKVKQHANEVRGVCHGDDGSPLVYNGIAIGVLSKIPQSCAEGNTSAIYTRVSHYLKFIRNARADKVTKFMLTTVLRP